MVEANLKIIEDLKNFLDGFSTDKELRKTITNGALDFSRNRKLPLKRVVFLIIREFFDNFGQGLNGCTKGAFCSQRGKLDSSFFKIWNQCLVDSFYHHYGESVKSWRGFRLQAVDGSTVYLPNTPEVRTHFGTHKNQHGSMPMARVMQIHDVLNDITVWGDIYPIAIGEQSIMADQVQHLAIDSLTLFDRGFPSFGLMYMMLNQETPRHFII